MYIYTIEATFKGHTITEKIHARHAGAALLRFKMNHADLEFNDRNVSILNIQDC